MPWSLKKNIMSKSSKYILAAGCSFTDENYKTPWHPEMDVSYDKWPAILGDKLGLLVKNVGLSGIDNTQIYHRAVADIIENHDKIELVVIGWTKHTRFMVYDTHDHHPSLYIKKLDKNKITSAGFTESAMDYYQWIEDNAYLDEIPFEVLFSRIYLLQKLCDSFGIKHVQASLCSQFDDKKVTPHNTLLNILRCKSFSKVNKKNIIGWPFATLLGGSAYDQHYTLNRISEQDRHPNKEGHKEIAELYYNKYNQIYL